MWRAHKRNTNEFADIVNLFSWQTNLWHQARSRQLKFRRIKTPRKENIALVFYYFQRCWYATVQRHSCRGFYVV
ncbi:hypothetical protein M8J76_005363 [Diaphorina citri]|nr:hypothetical protein M8J75_011216 [Diaphorina citri]KAI5736613.1 hypothetical protein M8J76_005363 [Diaphorina citri]